MRQARRARQALPKSPAFVSSNALLGRNQSGGTNCVVDTWGDVQENAHLRAVICIGVRFGAKGQQAIFFSYSLPSA